MSLSTTQHALHPGMCVCPAAVHNLKSIPAEWSVLGRSYTLFTYTSACVLTALSICYAGCEDSRGGCYVGFMGVVARMLLG